MENNIQWRYELYISMPLHAVIFDVLCQLFYVILANAASDISV